ncbi:hypothetical protein MCETHM1_00683 [Flavobacteriaceae bacterium]
MIFIIFHILLKNILLLKTYKITFSSVEALLHSNNKKKYFYLKKMIELHNKRQKYPLNLFSNKR